MENIIRETERLYNKNADFWVRKSPKSFSDFIARPHALSACLPLDDKLCLDVGCGEGYFSRLLAARGAKKVSGIDLSLEMIKRAIDMEKTDPLGIQYYVGDITKPLSFKLSSIDLVTAIFVFNYLTIEDTQIALTNIKRVLRPNGHLLFVVPHPFLLCTWKHLEPFYESQHLNTPPDGRG
jgi:SAM-dependent methyltransferase